jgi:two-component system, OmpR family, phosphate regulon response regulator PhoB
MALKDLRTVLFITQDIPDSKDEHGGASDDAPLIIVKELLAREFNVIVAHGGCEGVRVARGQLPDVILLDLMMPDLSGPDACDLLRSTENTRHIPLLVMSGATDDVHHRIRAFERGADDLILKPLQASELLARIRSKIRRVTENEEHKEQKENGELGKPEKSVQCGNLSLNISKIEASVEGRVVPLSVLEFNLLLFFVEHRNRVMSRQTILDALWHGAAVSNRTVDTHMASLRKKLNGFDHPFTTIYAAGYMLNDPGASN